MIIGDGETVERQIPASGESMPKGCNIILYTEENMDVEEVYVPDLTGLTVKEANRKLSKLGLNLKPLGGASNITGAVCSGVMNYKDCYVPAGTIIEAYFIVNNETG